MSKSCKTFVTIDGNVDKLHELHSILESIGETPSIKNVLIKRGVKEVEYGFKGFIDDYELIDNDVNPRIEVLLNSEWNNRDDLIDMIHDMFAYYDAEEDENLTEYYFSYEVDDFSEFGTNDWQKKYYKNRYFIYDSDLDSNFYYSRAEKALKHLRRRIPELGYDDLEDEEMINDTLQEVLDEDTYVEYHKYRVSR